jgi:hypothetical protein
MPSGSLEDALATLRIVQRLYDQTAYASPGA